MTRKINNSYLLGQSNVPTVGGGDVGPHPGGQMIKTRSDGTLVWEAVDDDTFVPVWSGGRGVLAGGSGGAGSASAETIEYITIASTGNATDFGNLNSPGAYKASCSNGSRGIWAGEELSGESNEIDYVTISTPGNSTDFGDLTRAVKRAAGASDGFRGVFAGGVGSSTKQNTIDYIAIDTTGNATDFGDLSAARESTGGVSNGTRGIYGGGEEGSYVNIIEYIVIPSKPNSDRAVIIPLIFPIKSLHSCHHALILIVVVHLFTSLRVIHPLNLNNTFIQPDIQRLPATIDIHGNATMRMSYEFLDERFINFLGD